MIRFGILVVASGVRRSERKAERGGRSRPAHPAADKGATAPQEALRLEWVLPLEPGLSTHVILRDSACRLTCRNIRTPQPVGWTTSAGPRRDGARLNRRHATTPAAFGWRHPSAGCAFPSYARRPNRPGCSLKGNSWARPLVSRLVTCRQSAGEINAVDTLRLLCRWCRRKGSCRPVPRRLSRARDRTSIAGDQTAAWTMTAVVQAIPTLGLGPGR